MKLRVFTAFSGYDDITDGEEWRDIKGFEDCYQQATNGGERQWFRLETHRGGGDSKGGTNQMITI